MLLAGEPNDIVADIWSGPMLRSLALPDGRRRALDLIKIMRPAFDIALGAYRIFPAEDERVLRIVRKIIKGLSIHHNMPTPAVDGAIDVDVLRTPFPEELQSALDFRTAHPSVCRYGYFVFDPGSEFGSVWLLTFYERTQFWGVVRSRRSNTVASA
jgi:hypothetical protein